MRRFADHVRRRFVAIADWRGDVEVVAPDAARSTLTPDGRLRTGNLAGLSMGAAIWTLSWPILTESFLNSAVGLTDTILAAQLGVAEADAVGSAAYILWFLGLIVMAIGIGATALISRSVGRGRLAIANAAVGQSILLAAGAGAVAGALIALCAEPVARSLTKSDEGAAAFAIYVQIVAVGTPFLAVMATGIAALRAAGDSVTPLYAMVIVNIVNIIASWLLCGEDLTRVAPDASHRAVILANPSPTSLGIAGIALGTILAEAVGAAIVLVLLLRGVGGVTLYRKRLRPHWHTMARLVRVGIPSFLETLGMWTGNFVVLLFVVYLANSDGMTGAHMIAIRIEAFSFLPGFSMGVAAATLAGQFLGAGSPRLAARAVFLCTAIGAGIMGAMGAALILAPRHIVSFLSAQPEHLSLVPAVLIVAGTIQIPFGIGIIVRGALRGVGDTRAVLVITWITTYLVRIPLAYAFSGVDLPLPSGGTLENPFVDTPTLRGLWIALCVEVVIRSLLFVWRFLGGSWAKARV